MHNWNAQFPEFFDYECVGAAFLPGSGEPRSDKVGHELRKFVDL